MSKNLSRTKSSANQEADLKIDGLDKISGLFLQAEKADIAFSQALEIIRRFLGPVRVSGYLYDQEKEFLVPLADKSPALTPPLKAPCSLAEPLPDSHSKLAPRLADLKNITPSDCLWPFAEENKKVLQKIGCQFIAPLSEGHKLLGMILLGAGRGKLKPTVPVRSFLQAAIGEVSLGLGRLSLLKSLKQMSFETRLKILDLETLQDVGVAIASILDLDQLTRELLLRAVSVLNVNKAMVLLSGSGGEGESESMSVAQTFGLEKVRKSRLSCFCGSLAVLENLEKGVPTILNDSAKVPKGFGCRKMMVVPIRFKEELLGAIMVGDKEGRRQSYPDFGESDLRLLGAMANQAGAAISNARLYRNVLEMKKYNENILASIASGVITTDKKGKVVSYNDSAARIFSIPAGQASGMKLDALFASLGLSALTGKLSSTLKKGSAYQETNLHASIPGGGKVVFNVSATPLSAAEDARAPRGMVVSVENISEGARVKEMLKRYVSANIVDMALEKEHELDLGGKQCEVTVLFSDIRGFTRLSEENTPAKVVELLNSYFDLMIDVVFRYNGTVDKIIGDAIMVLFGAPFAFKDDTRRAVGCALAMLEALEAFNAQRKKQGAFPLSIGVGLNRGTVISGNIGSTKHMDYTVIGDAVNLASRLVSHAEPGQILISRDVYDNLGRYFNCRKMERLTVKGKKHPVEVYEVLNRNGKEKKHG